MGWAGRHLAAKLLQTAQGYLLLDSWSPAVGLCETKPARVKRGTGEAYSHGYSWALARAGKPGIVTAYFGRGAEVGL